MCLPQSSSIRTAGAFGREEEVNVSKLQTRGGERGKGRRTTGKTNTSRFVFSMATGWRHQTRVPSSAASLLIRTVFSLSGLARSKKKIVQWILFLLSHSSFFFFLHYMIWFDLFQFIRKGDWSREYSRCWVGLCSWSCLASYSRKQSHSCSVLWESGAGPQESGCSLDPRGGASSPWRAGCPCRIWCSRWSSPSPGEHSDRLSTRSTAGTNTRGQTALN